MRDPHLRAPDSAPPIGLRGGHLNMRLLRPSDPRILGQYSLFGRLGSGGMGQVYLGRSPGGRPVAVKVIHPSVADEPTFRTRFRREVEAARRVGGFHTAQVVDADPEADPPWIVSAYIPGPSLRDAVNEHGPLPPASVLTLGAGLAEGLSAVHACGLVHRDLKPSNVLIGADGPRILDFGIAHLMDASALTASGTVIGTPAFMSPEQARGDDDELGPASDVFALGTVLAFAATGRSPFAAPSLAAAVYQVLDKEPDLSSLPDPLRGLVAGCLAKAPADRPDLTELVERLAPHARPEDWLPASIVKMIGEHSRTAPNAAAARNPGTPPEPETVQPAETSPGNADPTVPDETNADAPAQKADTPPRPGTAQATAPQGDAGPTVPDEADGATGVSRQAVVNTAEDRRSPVRHAAGGPPATDPGAPSAAPRRPESGKPSRRKWLIAISASAAAVLLVTSGVVVACAPFGSGPDAKPPVPVVTAAGPPKAAATSAEPTKAETTRTEPSETATPTATSTDPKRTPTTSSSTSGATSRAGAGSGSSRRPAGPAVALSRGRTGDYNEHCQAPECAKMRIVMTGFEPNTDYHIEPVSPTDDYSNPGATVTTNSSGYEATERFDYNGVGEKVYIVVRKNGTEVARSNTIVWPSG
ncbi:serine/threonine-protein kinase [Actinomadura rifamycini]|uniref:serine/threonine-protein kinase n=1 Tax=Actinomadura rifamycini TaxID=31962 RepID=UPI001FE1E834|nr:serine/threonine-protein kinase [Actinomadura rifamycini]